MLCTISNTFPLFSVCVLIKTLRNKYGQHNIAKPTHLIVACDFCTVLCGGKPMCVYVYTYVLYFLHRTRQRGMFGSDCLLLFFASLDTFEMVSEDDDGKVIFKVNYHYMSQVKNASDTNSAARSRRLAQEAVTLSTSLPLSSSSSVFVRCDEERLDIMKVQQHFITISRSS